MRFQDFQHKQPRPLQFKPYQFKPYQFKAWQLLTDSFVLFLLIVFSTLLLSALTGCEQSTRTEKSTAHNAIKQNAEKQQKLRVMSPDWGIVAELVAMGYPPVAAGDVRTYPDWVGRPKLPAGTIDLGARFEPNPELMAQMDVDLVIDAGFYEHLRGVYGDTPVKSIGNDAQQAVEIAKIENFIKQSQQIGEYINQPELAQDYIQRSQTFLQASGKDFQAHYPNAKKFAVVQFVDSHNLRAYSRNSLFEPTLSSMNLELVEFDKGNAWGFVNIKTADLIQLDDDVCLLVIEPFSQILREELTNSLVWQRLGYGADTANARCLSILPPTWIYGGLSSMVNIADSLKNTQLQGKTDIAKSAHKMEGQR